MNIRKRNLVAIILGVLLIVGLTACSTDDGEVSDSGDEAIKMGLAPYPQLEIITSILESGYEELGYETEIVEGDLGFMYLGVSQGDIDIYADGWLPVLHANYIERYGDKLEVGKSLYENASMGITVPSYMEDINTIEDLKNNADLFENRLIGIEPSTGVMLRARETMEAYEMEDVMDILDSSTPAMLAEVDGAIRNEEPIVFLGWRPHKMFSDYDLKILEDDKGIWESDNIHSIFNPDFEEKYPEAYEWTEGFEIDIEELEDLLVEAEESNMTNSEIGKRWFEENRAEFEDLLQ